MTAFTASTVPLAVRVRNARYDGMVTGYIHGAPNFSKADPGGYIAASFTLDQRLGFRSDIMQPYSRVYFYNRASGDTVFEGDVTHPGRATGTDGALFEVQVDGGAERMRDWSGAHIYVDRDLTAWSKIQSTSLISSKVEAGDDRGGGGGDALQLAFQENTHVETNYRIEAIYQRFIDASQEMGRFNYSWDGGHTSGSPGWLVRSIATPPSSLVRSQILNVGGGGYSGAVRVISYPTGPNQLVLQLIWTGGSSNTGTLDNVWASILNPSVTARMWMKDGTDMPGATYQDYVTADMVVGDMLGTSLLNTAMDGANATIDLGSSYQIWQLAYPDGTTPADIMEDLMRFEPAMSWFVGASTPGIDKYSFRWVVHPTAVRYEAIVWEDEYSNGVQPVDQYNEVVTRWRSTVGNPRMSVATQSIPEMTAVGRTRRFFQDLTDTTGHTLNADQSNINVLADHRYPQNSGQVKIARPITDLKTGRTVQPYDIQEGEMIRLVGADPYPDSLNSTGPDGSTLCRIIKVDYSGADHAATLDLDSIPISLFNAIMNTRRSLGRSEGVPIKKGG